MSTDRPAFLVSKATLCFDVREDRICLACEGVEDAKTAVWLTARLSSALVGYLLNLRVQLPTLPQDGCGESQAPELNGGMGLHTTEPVSIDDASDSLVAIAIDIVKRTNDIQLSFRNETAPSKVELVLRHDQITQWLEGFKNCYQLAGWPTAVWWEGDSSGPLDSLRENVTLH